MRQWGVALVGAVAALSACSVADAPVPSPPPPPPPPAACLLDTAALATATGLTWAPDATTASDTRCVYDPSGTPRPPDGPAFLAVDVAPGPDPVAELDSVAALCEDGSRAPAAELDGAGQDSAGQDSAGQDSAGQDGSEVAGFVCRFQEDHVFAAVAHEGQLVTLSASAVPPGTTAARLVVAFDQQVMALGR